MNILNGSIILGLCFFCISSCRSKENRDAYVVNNFNQAQSSTDSFAKSLENHSWPEKELPDSIKNFAEVCDTFYVSKKLSMSVNGYDTIHFFYPPQKNTYRQISDRAVCIESNSFLPYPEAPFVINGPIDFKNCHFYFKTFHSLHGIAFRSFTNFENCTFPDSSIIEDLNFENTLVFSDSSKTKNLPIFLGDQFSHGITFNSYTFNSVGSVVRTPTIFFYGNTFHSDIYFINCKIFGMLDFSGCSFNQNSRILLQNTPLPDTINLAYSKIEKVLDLGNVGNIDGKVCYINLVNADIDKIRFRYNHFKLYFPNRLSFDSLETNDLIASTYEQVLNNFKRNGFMDSYEMADIEYSEWKSKFNWIYKLSDFWWKFGYQKWRIIIYSIGLIFIFSIFNFRYYNRLQHSYPVEGLSWKKIPFSSYSLISFLRKFFAVVLYTGLLFFRFSIDFKIINFQPMRFVALIILQYAVGLICTGFLLNWIFKG